MRPDRSTLDRIADRGIQLMLALYTLARGPGVQIEGYMMTLTQRAAPGAREGNG